MLLDHRLLLSAVCSVLILNGCNFNGEAVPDSKTADTVRKAALNDPAAQWRDLDLKKYPDADTILLDDIELVEYNPDGSYKRSDESWSLIVTEAGRRSSQVVNLHFNTFYNTEPKVELDIIKADGRVVKPQLQKKITTEASQMQANIYDPANKVLSIGIPELEIGDIVHCKWSRQTVRARMSNAWCDLAVMQGRFPILHYTYTISAPEKFPLKKLVVKDEVPGTLKKSEKRSNGRILYTFEASNVPQVIPEPDMPPYYLHSMRILSSTCKDWQEVSRWYYNLCEPRLKAVSPELVAMAKKLTAGKTPRQAVRALFDFVSKEIRYTGVTNENTAPGYEPHDVKDTFAQKHGVCRDKAALLAAMLREASLDGFTVLFMAGDPKDSEVPNFYFNHAITGVKLPDGELVLMDPTDENSSDLLPAYGMDKSFLCATREGDILRRSSVIAAEKNLLEVKTSGTIDGDLKLKLVTTLIFKGFNDNIYRGAFARWPQDYRQQFVSAAIKRALPGAELKKLTVLPKELRDLSKDFQLVLEYEVPEFVNIKWAAGEMRMPFIGGAFGALNFMIPSDLLKKRRYPMRFESTAAVNEICSITLPENLKAVALPVYKKVDNDVLSMDASVKITGGKLIGQRKISLNKLEVPTAKYQAFRNALQDIASAGKRRVIVNRQWKNQQSAETASAQALVHYNNVTIRFTDLDNSVVDQQGCIELLNYSGIKEYSELTRSFVPGISTAEFVSGSVTAPDGKVVKVDRSAIKVLDGGDGNAAPRYPMPRKVVVPVPGVNVGSRIDYHWRLSCSDAQSTAAMLSMAASLPARNRQIKIILPRRLEKRFNFDLPQSGFDVVKRYEKGNVVITVSGKNIPMLANEPSVPPEWLFAPSVGVSSCSEKYYQQGMKAFKKASADSEMASAIARRLVSNVTDVRQKIQIIRDAVAKNIRPAGPEINTLGWKYISGADVTLRDGYGNSMDRAVLLYAMLQAVGINNIRVIAASGFPGTDEFTARYDQFNVLPIDFYHILLLVKSGDEEFYLNDTSEYARLGTTASEDALALDLESGEHCTVAPAAECQSAVEQEWVIKCLADGAAEITRISSFYGTEYESRNRFFTEITPEAEAQYQQRVASDMAPAGELISFKRDFKAYPGRIEVTVKVPLFWLKSGEYISFQLPEIPAESYLRTAGKRTLPYWSPGGSDFKAAFNVTLLPEWKECLLAPDNYQRSIPGCRSEISLNSKFSENTLDVARVVRWTPFYLNQGAYSLLEDLQKVLANPANRTFLFKSTGK